MALGIPQIRRSFIETRSRCHPSWIVLLIASGCAAGNDAVHDSTGARSRYLMGTLCEISAGGVSHESIDLAFVEIARIESFLSTWRDGSELSQINRSPLRQRAALSAELFDLLALSMEWAGRTEGAFNPLIRPLIDVWKTREAGALPDADAIRHALENVRLDGVVLDPVDRSATRLRQAAFEEGGFGKGYANDRALRVLREHGATHAVVNFGGQVSLFGFDRGFDVAIADPKRRDNAAISISLSGGSVSTSSGSERTFTVDGVEFSHIFDPRTGRALPSRGSVTVVHESGTIADILSTALYVMGPDNGVKWARDHRIDAIFLVPSGSGYDIVFSDADPLRSLSIRILDSKFKLKGDHV